MSKIYFRIQSKKNSTLAPIYLRLSLGHGKDFKRKTSLSINTVNWNKTKNIPKGDTPQIKNLRSDLRNLENFILDQLNIANSEGNIINGNWLQTKIDLHFNKFEQNSLSILTEYGKHFLDKLQYKVDPKTHKRGVSVSTFKKYQTIVNKLIAFDKHNKVTTRITDVNLLFQSKLIKYFKEVDLLGENTIGRYLKFVKTICLDAEKNEHKVSPQLKHFQGFSVEAPIVILSFKELEKIKKANLVNENHQIARDWLIIGCFVGQRVSDLFKMNKSFVQHIQDHDFIILTQQKTGKRVQIPIHFQVQEILAKRKGEFPPVFTNNFESSKTLFNRYLKELCKIAEIDSMGKGNKFDKKTKRNITGIYPKHELVSSHICRRSFASNHYATELYPTPILMNITAHKTESMFLTYIGKSPIEFSLQLAKIWQKIGAKRKEELKEENNTKTKLKVVKTA